MSTDETVTKDLIETLEDGKEGYAQAADKLADSDGAHAETLRGFSQQRAQLSDELQAMARSYGDHIEEDGSVTATLHRGWLSLRDALSGSDPSGVLRAALQGEDHAVAEYEKALAEEDISPDLRTVVQRQMQDVRAARDQVKAMVDAAS